MSLVYWALSGLLSLSVASVASAVIIDSGDGTGNVTAPVPDPGWSYVGTRDVLTAVYLGNGWVLTANHVGAGDVTLGGFVYPYLPGTALQLHNPDWTLADLLLFSIDPYPVMPLLPIATNAAPLGTDLILIGHGLNRGPVTSWDANGPPPPGPIYGYDWAVGWTMRWGTNDIEDYPVAPVLGTWSFASEFDASGSPHEAQGAHGDSGGAAFVFDGFDWVLAGVTFAIGEHPGQPANVSLYGQSTHAADLSVYSDEILYVVGLPEPTGGLAAGLVLLLGLWRRRSRREIQRAAWQSLGTRRRCAGMRYGGLLALLLLGTATCSPETDRSEPLVHTREGLSPPLHIDRKYGSMEGPSAETQFVLQPGPRELLWVTAYRTEIVDSDGQPDPKLSEFMCHNNLDFDAQSHADVFRLERPLNFGRVFTASQGVFEIEFPKGFAIPVLSDEPFTANTMVLNHNVEGADFSVRHRISVDYVRDADAPDAFQPLYPVAGMVMALVEGRDGFYGLDQAPDAAQAGASCAPGHVAPNAPEGTQHYTDKEGRVFTPHWVVPPGREVRHTLITEVLNVPFETTLHYIGVHLHPFAESLELRDLTTDETLYRATTRAPAQGIGLAAVDHYVSVEGIPLYPDHEYEMVSVYENPTDVEKDAMAVFFFYFHDREAAGKLGEVRAELAATAANRSGV